MNTCFRRVAAVVFVVLILAAAAGGQEPKKLSAKEIAKTTAQADKLLAEGKLTEARQVYQAISQDDPANTAAALKVARISEDLMDWDGAIAAYRIVVGNAQALAKADAYAGLSNAYLRSGKYAEAADAARKAIAQNPALPSPHLNLAQAALRTGSNQEALDASRKAVELAPTSGSAHAILAESLVAAGQTAEAEPELRKAMELDPKLAAPYLSLAEIQRDAGDLDGAIASASKALELDSTLTQAYVIRGQAQAAAGRQSAAYSDLSTAALSGQNLDAQVAFGQLQKQQDNIEGAVVSFRRALSIDPNNAAASLYLAEILVARGEYAPASDLLTKAVEHPAEAARAYTLIGQIHDKQKEVDAAMQAYDRAIELDPKLAAAYYHRGVLLHRQKNDVARAVTDLEKAVALDPGNIEAMTDLGVALYDAKQAARAVEVLQKVVGTPNYKNTTGFAVLGLALKDQQNFGDAVSWLEKAAGLAPEWWLPHWGAAWSYFGLIKKGCPCGPEDADRIARMKSHAEKLTSLQKGDATLDQRLDALLKGQKIK